MKKRISIFIVTIVFVFIMAVGCFVSSKETSSKDDTSKKAKLVYNYLLEKGDLSPEQAAGITAVIKQQSNFNTSVHDSGDISTTGLMCWSFARQEQLVEFASKRGKELTNFYTQLDFILEEIDVNSEYYQLLARCKRYTLDDWNTAPSPEQAALSFTCIYVRPATVDQESLQALAREIYEACYLLKEPSSHLTALCFIKKEDILNRTSSLYT